MASGIRLCVLIFVIGVSSYGQDTECGTIATQRDIEALKNLQVTLLSRMRTSTTTPPTKIAITAHIARRSDGTGGLTAQELADAIVKVNEIYTLTNMEFFIFGDINYIDDDRYFDFQSAQEVELANQHFVENTINVYFFNSVLWVTGFVCGYARYPQKGIDRIVMVNRCTTDGSTFPHELGHYFALYHTHGKTNTGTTHELVTRGVGSNCETAGDDLCDTAADPNLRGLVDGSCGYTGKGRDANGQLFVPNTRNLMSYSRKNCREELSQGQADRIVAAYQQYKTYLYDRNYLADFNASSREVCLNNSLRFIDESVNAASYVWTFEGGNPASSTDANPTVAYSALGTYDVTLVITDPEGETDTKTFVDYVTVKDEVSSNITSKSGSFEENNIEEAIYNFDDSKTWQKTSAAFSEGSGSVYMDFINYNKVGENDYLVVATLNTSMEKVFALTFDYAYAPFNSQFIDGLEIVYREPCGEWQSAWIKTGNDLATANDQRFAFVPGSDQWESEVVVFEVDPSATVTEVAFKSINGSGNNLYIDNYSVNTFDRTFEILDVQAKDASCPNISNGSVTITVSTDSQFDYSLDGENFVQTNIIDKVLPGNYNVVVRNALGTEKTQQVVVGYDNEYPANPVIELINGDLTVTSGGETFQWYKDRNFLDGATGASYSFSSGGSYTVFVSNGVCSVFSDPFTVLPTQEEVDSDLKIYPNPVKEFMSISLPNGLQKEISKIIINDLSGRKMLEYTYEDRLDVSALEAGLYILHFELDGEKVSRRFLKE